MKPRFNKQYGGLQCRVFLAMDKKPRNKVTVSSPQDAFNLVKDELCSADREVFLSVLLTTANEVIGVETIAIGTLSACMVSPREVFKSAILANAAAILVCHNHPSGSIKPSSEDKHLTDALKCAGELLGIPLKDHLIITRDGFESLLYS